MNWTGPKLGISRFQVRRPNHSATLPPEIKELSHDIKYQWKDCESARYENPLRRKKERYNPGPNSYVSADSCAELQRWIIQKLHNSHSYKKLRSWASAERDWFKFSMFHLKFQKRIVVLASPAQTSCTDKMTISEYFNSLHGQKYHFSSPAYCSVQNTIQFHEPPCQNNPQGMVDTNNRDFYSGTWLLNNKGRQACTEIKDRTNRVFKLPRLCSSSNASFEVLSTTRSCNSKCLIPIFTLKAFLWDAGMSQQWWEHSPLTNVARVRFPDPASNVGWVCWFSSLHREVFSGYSGFSSPQKTTIWLDLC